MSTKNLKKSETKTPKKKPAPKPKPNIDTEKLDLEKLLSKIITIAGFAKSEAMKALYFAKSGDFEMSIIKMSAANQYIEEASIFHLKVVGPNGEYQKPDFKTLFIHAEDRLLTSQTIILLVGEMIGMHQLLKKK